MVACIQTREICNKKGQWSNLPAPNKQRNSAVGGRPTNSLRCSGGCAITFQKTKREKKKETDTEGRISHSIDGKPEIQCYALLILSKNQEKLLWKSKNQTQIQFWTISHFFECHHEKTPVVASMESPRHVIFARNYLHTTSTYWCVGITPCRLALGLYSVFLLSCCMCNKSQRLKHTTLVYRMKLFFAFVARGLFRLFSQSNRELRNSVARVAGLFLHVLYPPKVLEHTSFLQDDTHIQIMRHMESPSFVRLRTLKTY